MYKDAEAIVNHFVDVVCRHFKLFSQVCVCTINQVVSTFNSQEWEKSSEELGDGKAGHAP